MEWKKWEDHDWVNPPSNYRLYNEINSLKKELAKSNKIIGELLRKVEKLNIKNEEPLISKKIKIKRQLIAHEWKSNEDIINFTLNYFDNQSYFVDLQRKNEYQYDDGGFPVHRDYFHANGIYHNLSQIIVSDKFKDIKDDESRAFLFHIQFHAMYGYEAEGGYESGMIERSIKKLSVFMTHDEFKSWLPANNNKFHQNYNTAQIYAYQSKDKFFKQKLVSEYMKNNQ
jgi:hypothetical protein